MITSTQTILWKILLNINSVSGKLPVVNSRKTCVGFSQQKQKYLFLVKFLFDPTVVKSCNIKMAKWGEGDPRWIVEERPDATNVNNWHW